MEQQTNYYSLNEELDDELTINFKKIFCALSNRKILALKVFFAVLAFFILLTFISAKKYTVDADLYINKTNNSNMTEINPYFISEVGAGAGGGISAIMGGEILTNEIELIQSPLVIDKVIKENNIVYKKKWGIIPNKKEGEYISTKAFLKKNISIENKKGTNIVSIKYKNKKPELAYNVVNSIINNYIELHKQLNNEKSKTDKKVIEEEYNKAKSKLENKIKSVKGIPSTAMSNTGNLSAMSAFSTSAQRAMSNIQNQYISGEKSQLEVKEDAEKVAQLASKLEWAKLVDEMSDTSKVLVLKEPQKLRDFEYSSPKLLINTILGAIFGIFAALFAIIYKEITDKKLAYSMLNDDIIYKDNDEILNLKSDLLANSDKKITFALFENIPLELQVELKNFPNITFVKAEISNDLIEKAKNSDVIYLVSTINKTESKAYKQVANILKKINIRTIKDLLV